MLLFLSSFFHDSVEETGEKGQKSCNIDPKISRKVLWRRVRPSAERLTPRTSDLKVQGSPLARRVVSVDKELYSPLSLFTQVYAYRRHTVRG